MRVRRSVAVVSAVLTGWGMALVMAQPAAAAPECDRPIPPPKCDFIPPEDPPPPTYAPIVAFDGARQTGSERAVHIWGWTTDRDAPSRAVIRPSS
ncbi:hypothetical protein [Verrucosispora sp. TAA-831]|uniref:hypothetical protein n=1 Tax=Verrucosispora sp. TAA-831 TaxID=3422227 RepID=UPI003D6EBBC8